MMPRRFVMGDVVTLRHHERLCDVRGFTGPMHGFCVPLVLIGPVGDEAPHGWVEPRDLALAAEPSDGPEAGR